MEHWGFFWEYGGERTIKTSWWTGHRTGMLKYTRIDTNWREHHGWPVSMRSFFFFYYLYSWSGLFYCCLPMLLDLKGTETRKKTKKKKENIAFLAFSWIEGFFCCWWWWLYTQSSFYSFGAYIIIYLLDLFLFLFLLFPSRSLLSMDGETQSMFLEYSAECEFGLAGYIYQVLRRLNKQVQSPFLNAI